jgi:radical SAM-linked protein
MIYRPLRKRSLENILSLAEKSLSNTGYEEISFTSLSTGDYPDLLPLLRMFNASCKSYPVAVSLPSLRVGSLSRDVLKEIKNIRKTGFTIAPEAGTQRLRNVINKNFTEKEYRETLRLLFKEGWHHLKLYFMIGLPSESRDDIEGIMDMAEMALKMGKETTGRHININMGISAFVPKPHTPFQWLGQLSYGELRSRQDTIRNRFKKRGINVKGQHIELSLLEAVFSRADHTCASLLEHAWRLGCRFDGWSESFDFQKWLSAAKRTGMNLHEFAERSLESDSVLPWDFIDIGITKAFLLSEFERSQQERTIPDCKDICRSCGLECNENTQNADHRSQNTEGRLQKTVHQIQRMKNQSPVLVQNFRKKTSDFSHLSLRNPHSLRMRIRFSKTGLLRYLSHREIISAFIRAMHRENVPLLYSEGFHPHPRVSFGPPLPVGVEGINEFLDIELRTSVDPSELLEKMNSSLPPGLKVFSVMPVDKNKKSLNDFISRYEYKVAIEKSFIKSLSSFLEAPRYNVAREKHDVDIRPMVEKAEITNGSLKLILVDTNTSKVRLYEILRELLHKTDGQLHKVPIQRLFLYGFCKQRGWIDPQEDEINEQRDCN